MKTGKLKIVSILLAVSLVLGMFQVATIMSGALSDKSVVINWEDGDLSRISIVGEGITVESTSEKTIQGSRKAVAISYEGVANTTEDNFVSIDIRDYKLQLADAYKLLINLTSNTPLNGGNAAHYGIMVNGKLYWDMAYMGGFVPNSNKGYVETNMMGNYVCLRNGAFSGNGSYDTLISLNKNNLANVQAILILPAINKQTVYVDDITILNNDDIPTVDLPAQGEVLCDWTGALNHVKSESPGGTGTVNLKNMEDCFRAENQYAYIDTEGKTYKSLYVQTEINVDPVQAKKAIDQATAGDGFIYGKIRFKKAKNGKGSECGVSIKMYCFANGNWQNSVNIISEGDAIINGAEECLIKFDVSKLKGMVPDTIAFNIMNPNYYDLISYAQIEMSPLFAADGSVQPTTTQATTQPTTTSPAPTTTTTEPSPSIKKGDVNGDGKVDVSDLRTLLQMVMKSQLPSKGTEAFEVCDYNSDGAINTMDLRAMLMNIL